MADNTETSVGNTVHVGGDNNGGQIAGGDITNVGDPQDRKTITSQQQTIQALQKTVNKLVGRLPTQELNNNEQIREQIADAVTGLSSLDSEPSQIEQAEAALANCDTEQAQALYRVDAESKAAAGAQLRGAAGSYRRLGALACLNDTAAGIEAYQNAVKVWTDEIDAWNQLGHLNRRTGQLDLAIEAYRNVEELASSTDIPVASCSSTMLRRESVKSRKQARRRNPKQFASLNIPNLYVPKGVNSDHLSTEYF